MEFWLEFHTGCFEWVDFGCWNFLALAKRVFQWSLAVPQKSSFYFLTISPVDRILQISSRDLVGWLLCCLHPLESLKGFQDPFGRLIRAFFRCLSKLLPSPGLTFGTCREKSFSHPMATRCFLVCHLGKPSLATAGCSCPCVLLRPRSLSYGSCSLAPLRCLIFPFCCTVDNFYHFFLICQWDLWIPEVYWV